jgi:carbohydrate esterase-like sialic acid-specific acetylesterase/putative metal-binding protein
MLKSMNKLGVAFSLIICMVVCGACSQESNCTSDRDCDPGYFCLSGSCELRTQSDGNSDGDVDAGNDAGNDAGYDAGTDAGSDTGTDAGTDAGSDPGSDAGSDAGTDAGSDAGTDAGPDAGDTGACFDPDNDGYGIGATCLGLDCAPNDAARHPGATEECNGLDDDCDELIDEDDVCPQENPYLWVFVMAGQSNMVGLGINAELGPPDAALVPMAHVFCDLTVHPNANCLSWQPLGPGYGVMPDRFGPELSFGRRLREHWPNRSIAILKVAEGATALADRWADGSGDLYQLLIQQVNTQMTDLQIAWTPQIAGFLWMQGESDACSSSQANAYYFNLRDFINALRADAGVDLMPITAGLIADIHLWPEADTVRDATSLLADYLGPMQVVETNDLPRHADDEAHYNTLGTLELGRRFAESVQTDLADMSWVFPDDFSSAQGGDFWRYETCTGGNCSLLSWDYFGNRFKNATESVLIDNGGLQPAALQTAELSWWAPANGLIEITASAGLAAAGGDGTRVTITRDDRVLAGPLEVTTTAATNMHLVLGVQQGHKLRFITDSGAAGNADGDTTNWQISIEMLSVDGD